MKTQSVLQQISIILCSVIFIFGCNSVKDDWEKAKQSNTINAYDEFLIIHPNSEFDSLAKGMKASMEITNAIVQDSLGVFLSNHLSPKPIIELKGVISNGQTSYSNDMNNMFSPMMLIFKIANEEFALLTNDKTVFKNLTISDGLVSYNIGKHANYRIHGRIANENEFYEGQLVKGQRYMVASYIEYLGDASNELNEEKEALIMRSEDFKKRKQAFTEKFGENAGVYTDMRDGKDYLTIKIGDQVILAENFAFKPAGEGCQIYNDYQKNIVKYGYLYDWNTAKSIAPNGWHLPSKAEWETLYKLLGGDDKLVYDQIIKGGRSGLDAVFAGYNQGGFKGLGEMADFWSSTPSEDQFVWTFTVIHDKAKLYKYGSGFQSVRLFKDN